MARIHSLKIAPWLVWGIAALFSLYTFLLESVPSVMIPELMNHYGIEIAAIGTLTASFFYTYIAMQVPSGILIDVFGPKKILKISFITCTLSVFWFAFSHYYWEGQYSRMLMGLGTAPAVVATLCLASRWFKPELFLLLITLTEFLVLGGGVLGAGGVAKCVVFLGWRETLITIGITGLILTLLSFFIIQDHPLKPHNPMHRISFKDSIKTTFYYLKKIISIKQVWISGLYAGLVFGIFPAFAGLWAVPYLMKRFQLTVDVAALFASTLFLGACFGNIVLGSLSLYITKKKPLMIVGSATSLLLLLFAFYGPTLSLPGLFVLYLLIGLFSSTYSFSFSLIGAYIPSEAKGLSMGLANMFCLTLGAPLFQPLIGKLLTWHKDTSGYQIISYSNSPEYDFALALLPLSLLLSLILGFLIKEPSSNPVYEELKS